MGHYSKDRFEQWLDNALPEYGNVEPRAGLETRVLANLESIVQSSKITRTWWRGFAVAALAACVVVLIWIGTNPPAKKWIAIARTPIAGHENFKSRNDVSPEPEGIKTQRTMAHRSPPTSSKEPRLAQFPSPQPLTEQEQLLARYIRDFPQEAQIVASEQTEAEARKELEELAMDKSLESNSDQRER